MTGDLPARSAAPLHDQGQERAGSARGHPPDRLRTAAPGQGLSQPGRRWPALRADLEAHRREPDGERPHRAHRRSTSAPKPTARAHELRATGQVVRFDGFLRSIQEGEGRRARTRRARRLPPTHGDTPTGVERASPRHSTSPSRRRATRKPRWSSGMEELGIGRPSTYASTLSTLIDRDYVKLEQKRLHAGRQRHAWSPSFLEKFFARYVEYDFTAALEEKLDLRIGRRARRGRTSCATSGREFSAAIGATSRSCALANVLDAIE